ncbi:hypothetical protein ON010_g15942 [Phytophthora cinnamomi]|nr:hypothetical protein ON010_g15942 [Phytophthora cinnamomi]
MSVAEGLIRAITRTKAVRSATRVCRSTTTYSEQHASFYGYFAANQENTLLSHKSQTVLNHAFDTIGERDPAFYFRSRGDDGGHPYVGKGTDEDSFGVGVTSLVLVIVSIIGFGYPVITYGISDSSRSFQLSAITVKPFNLHILLPQLVLRPSVTNITPYFASADWICVTYTCITKLQILEFRYIFCQIKGSVRARNYMLSVSLRTVRTWSDALPWVPVNTSPSVNADARAWLTTAHAAGRSMLRPRGPSAQISPSTACPL